MNDHVKYNHLQNALNCLSPNCDRETWIKIGTAIKDALPDQNGRALFHKWSQGGTSYLENTCDAQWRSFRPGNGPGQVSVATLFHFAKENGYRAETQPEHIYVTNKEPEDQTAKEQSERLKRSQWRDKLWASTSDEATAKYVPIYLQSRGLAPQTTLPYTRATEFHPQTGKPALISAMHNELGEIAAVHTIPLNFDGSKDTNQIKKMAGFPSGACIWLDPLEEITEVDQLCFAEGLETAIAARQILRELGITDIVVAAVGTANNLSKQSIPKHIEHIHIFADKDRSQTGEKQALRCINEYHHRITIHVPPMEPKPHKKSVDWLDWLNNSQPINKQDCKASSLFLPDERVVAVELVYGVVVKALPEDIERIKSLREFRYHQKQHNKQYPDPFEIHANTRLLVLDWPLGSGKTTKLEELFKEAKRALALSPRIALTSQMAERLDVIDYLDCNHHKIRHDKVACTINSAGRIDIVTENRVKPLDMLAFDEPEQSLPVVLGNDMLMKNESGPLYEQIRFLVRNSRLVVLTDAFISPETISVVQRMMGIQTEQVQIERHRYIDPEKEFVFLPDAAHLLEKTYKMLSKNKRLAIACTGREDAKATEKEIKRRFPEKKVLCIHADSDRAVRQTLSNPNESWKEYDVVIWSPTVSSGVNFDVPKHFDHVMLFARSIPGIGWTDLMQMIARVRQPCSKVLYAYVEAKQYKWAIREETIREQALQGIEETKHLLRIEVDEDGSVNRHPINEEHFDAWCELEAVKRRRSTNVKKSLLSYLRRSGHRVHEVEKSLSDEKKKETGGSFATSKKQNKQELYSQIFNAPDISMSEAKSIKQSNWSTPEERQAAKKASIKHHFGLITPELVERSEGHEKLKRKVSNLTHGILWANGERRFFERKDQADFDSGFDKHLSHNLVTGRLLGELLMCIDRHAYPGLIEQLNKIQDMRVNSDANICASGQPSTAGLIFPPNGTQNIENKDINGPAYPCIEVIDSLQNKSRVGVSQLKGDESKLASLYVTKYDLEDNEEFQEELAHILRKENREAARCIGLQIHLDNLNKQVGCILNVFGIKRKSKETTGKVRAYRLELEELQEQLLLTSTYYHRLCERIQLDNDLDALLETHNMSEIGDFQDSGDESTSLCVKRTELNKVLLE